MYRVGCNDHLSAKEFFELEEFSSQNFKCSATQPFIVIGESPSPEAEEPNGDAFFDGSDSRLNLDRAFADYPDTLKFAFKFNAAVAKVGSQKDYKATYGVKRVEKVLGYLDQEIDPTIRIPVLVCGHLGFQTVSRAMGYNWKRKYPQYQLRSGGRFTYVNIPHPSPRYGQWSAAVEMRTRAMLPQLFS